MNYFDEFTARLTKVLRRAVTTGCVNTLHATESIDCLMPVKVFSKILPILDNKFIKICQETCGRKGKELSITGKILTHFTKIAFVIQIGIF